MKNNEPSNLQFGLLVFMMCFGILALICKDCNIADIYAGKKRLSNIQLKKPKNLPPLYDCSSNICVLME